MNRALVAATFGAIALAAVAFSAAPLQLVAQPEGDALAVAGRGKPTPGPTKTPRPTKTPAVTNTPTWTPTATNTPTVTNTPTWTPTAANTPTPPPTLTPTPPTTDAVVVAAVGDIACPPTTISTPTATTCHQMATSDLLAGTTPDAVITLGDNQYDNGELNNFNLSYDPSWGRYKAITKPSPGNHEYNTAGAVGYYGYFGAAAGDPAKGYYSFNLGSWHIIALNSNCAKVPCSAGSAQEQWLRTDLAANPALCTLAFWHHPRFTSGTGHSSDLAVDPFWQALYQYGADVVLSGHVHNYERFAPQAPNGTADPVRGIREFVVGTGGKSLYASGTGIDNSEVRNSSTFGVLKLTLRPTGYDWAFTPEASKTFTDTGSHGCHS